MIDARWMRRPAKPGQLQLTGRWGPLLGLLFVTPSACAAPVLVGAGDIAECASQNDELTAGLIDRIPGAVFTLGDNAYETGAPTEFALCYDASWGRHKHRTRPSAGNHDYETPGAAGYYGYFGEAAGDPLKGYYSYDLGRWHVVVINSNCYEVEECDRAAQERWLHEDLVAHPAPCTLAYWHHTRFTSGEWHGPAYELQPVWAILYDAGVDVVLSAHEHNYERFARQDPEGRADPRRGIRQFVVGTGGRGLYPLGPPAPNSEVRNDETLGVLELTLHSSSYDWRFVPAGAATFTDSGSDRCH